jgi:hypothetical protein
MSSPNLPGWIYQGDGRLVPLEADKIAEALFNATENLGLPNAFLARELTESILHFLAQEYGETIPTAAQVAELAVKVLRELGQPDLAQVFSQQDLSFSYADLPEDQPEKLGTATLTLPFKRPISPDAFLGQCARQYSLQTIFSRDLVAAQEDGWLTLVDLEHPGELAGGVLDWPGREGRSLLGSLLQGRKGFGSFVVLDSPEHALESGPAKNRQLALFVRDLKEGLETTGLHAILNLNAALPPPWAWQPNESPLFQGPLDSQTEKDILLDACLEEILGQFPPGDPIRLDWHLQENDFVRPEARNRLMLVCRRALEDPQVSFVFDRSHRALTLGEGLNRKYQTILQVVGLHLAPLLDLPDLEKDVDLFLQKLFSLVRMAASAGVQKRHFLRQQQANFHTPGFFLDRARLVIIPIGLPAVIHKWTNQGLASSKQGLALAKKIVDSLTQHCRVAGGSANLECVLDNPWWTGRGQVTGPLSSPHLVGLTCADFSAPLFDQLRAGSVLHHITATGTLTLLLPPGPVPNLEFMVDLLYQAWKKTEVVRLRLHRLPFPAQEPPDLLS